MLKRREREKIISEINVIPLIDVSLVLLIIFMVTTPFIMQGSIKINLPSAKAASDELEEKTIVLAVTSDGRTYLNTEEINNPEVLEERLAKELSTSSSKKVIIEGDRNSSHGMVVNIMGIAKKAGAEKLAISTIPEDNKVK